jgi:hypothetical protein
MNPEYPRPASMPARAGRLRLAGRRPAARTLGLPTHLALLCWLTLTWAIGAVQRRMPARSDDRGEALAWAAITVGAVLIAGAVLLVIRGKAQTIANNVCTNADPSTC